MELTIRIPQNDYVQPTNPRQEVVQAICDAFLTETSWRVFHPYHGANNGCRNATRYMSLKHPRFDYPSQEENPVRIYGCEVAAAFKALREAGYHIYKIHEYGTWMGYICDKKPFCERGTEVSEFRDFID